MVTEEKLNQREFKGYVTASLENMKSEITLLRNEVEEVRKNTSWLMVKVGGISSGVSILATIIFNMIK